MEDKLEELAQFVRETLPHIKAISNLQKNVTAGVVIFNWHSRRFAVKPSLEVLEVKGDGLYITGASILMNAAFTRQDKNRQVLTAVNETVGQAEDLLNHHQLEKGLSLLEIVKNSLSKLAGLNGMPRAAKEQAGAAGSPSVARETKKQIVKSILSATAIALAAAWRI